MLVKFDRMLPVKFGVIDFKVGRYFGGIDGRQIWCNFGLIDGRQIWRKFWLLNSNETHMCYCEWQFVPNEALGNFENFGTCGSIFWNQDMDRNI